MKRLVSIVFALILSVASVAHANSATDYIREEGQSPAVYMAADEQARCDFRFIFTDVAAIEWTDGNDIYRIKGHPERLAYLYVHMLPLESWDVCRYILGSCARVSYGAVSNNMCESVDDYATEFEIAFTEHTHVYPLTHFVPDEDDNDDEEYDEAPDRAETEISQYYILNIDTKKFHYPDCRDVDKMEDENRRDYHGTRSSVIDKGYVPCGHCNP